MAAGLTEPLYTRDILRLAANIPGQRSFADLNGDLLLRSPTCGSRLAMWVVLDCEERVVEIEQAVEACAFGQAAAALVGVHAIGIDYAQAKAVLAAMERWLGGEGDPPWPGIETLEPARARRGRHGAILLPFRALVAAIARASE